MRNVSGQKSSRLLGEARFSIEGLSALVYGIMPLEEIEYMGWGEVRGSSRQILQRWFPVQPIHNAFEF
jgi:hypothetical protein